MGIKDKTTQGKKLGYSDYNDCFDYNLKPIYDMDLATSNFFGNVFIILNGLATLRHGEPSIYGQILPEIKIRFEDLKITHFNTKSLDV